MAITIVDESKDLIIAKNRDITPGTKQYEIKDNSIEVLLNSSNKKYSYCKKNISCYKVIREVAKTAKIFHDGVLLDHTEKCLDFGDFFKVFSCGGASKIFTKDELNILEFENNSDNNYLAYLKELLETIGDKKDNDDIEQHLKKQFESLNEKNRTLPLLSYFTSDSSSIKRINKLHEIFPFSCNLSQLNAIDKALKSVISVIKGPPGTGKTQTILNIVANAIINDKTVAVVSNNNSATQNVYDKLKQYNFDFIVASLGRRENKETFIKSQTGIYPDMKYVGLTSEDELKIQDRINAIRDQIKDYFRKLEGKASLKKTLCDLQTEEKYFEEYYKINGYGEVTIRDISQISSKVALQFWNKCKSFISFGKRASLIFKIKSRFVYGIGKLKLYKKEPGDLIPIYQRLFYTLKKKEIEEEILEINEDIQENNYSDMEKELERLSLKVFENHLYNKYYKYKKDLTRQKFIDFDLYCNPVKVVQEYPVILSTTFSIKNSLGNNFEYDYLIIDEASQVDLITGVLALSCAKNVVIVGDTMQLPNVISDKDKKIAAMVNEKYNIEDKYRYDKNSLLESICKVIPNVPKTLLREHYRCHPKIINFCNEKFYDNKLVIMTKDNGEKDVLGVVKTVSGNHSRGNVNHRQIDEIEESILPEIREKVSEEEIGIISPYNDQGNELKREINDIDISTVHKFQGREKEAIIITTVADQINEFVDNPNLLNVAISRAKRYLRLVVSNDEKNEKTLTGDLLKYIEYNNFEVNTGKVRSMFDLLYKCNREERQRFLSGKKRISKFDSENIAYNVIEELLEKKAYRDLGCANAVKLNQVIIDNVELTSREKEYLNNPNTHVDFLIYKKVTKEPILGIEVDGTAFHQEGSKQDERDALKNNIFNKSALKLIRLRTDGSREDLKIQKALDEVLIRTKSDIS